MSLDRPSEGEIDRLRRERDHYRGVAEETGRSRLREAESLSGIISRLREAEHELQGARDQLEERVASRTAELEAANSLLRAQIAERQRVEGELRRSEDRFRMFMRYFPGLAFIKDSRGHVLFANEGFRTYLGVDPDGIIGKANAEVFDQGFAAKISEDDALVVRSGRAERVEDHLAGRVWLTFKFPIQRPGAAPDLGGFSLDITDQRRAEQERIRLESEVLQRQKLESLGVLAGGIAHDFNNLLTAILGNASLLLETPLLQVGARSSVEQIEAASRRAADLCQQMLAYSGRGRFVIGTLALNEVIDEIVPLFKASLSKRARLTLRLDPAGPRVRGDVTQIRQVLMNLVINAGEAIGENDGDIEIATGSGELDAAWLAGALLGQELPAGPYVWLEVNDTGCGIDEETRRRIFEPFFTTKFTGRGLGLSAVLGIVRGHGGALFLDSAPGRGTRFRVVLPPAQTGDQAQTAAAAGDDAWTASGTVLLVDDEEQVRRVGSLLLERLGFDVVTAADGSAAVEALRSRREQVRLVLLDYTMPGPGAAETIRTLDEIVPRIPVVLASGYAESDVSERLDGVDAAAFIAKPYRLADLRRHLRQVLEASRPGR
jgi:two-component system, cell cycle sensor histidine kinase and response regulator CckA